jgi:hypothetical protein
MTRLIYGAVTASLLWCVGAAGSWLSQVPETKVNDSIAHATTRASTPSKLDVMPDRITSTSSGIVQAASFTLPAKTQAWVDAANLNHASFTGEQLPLPEALFVAWQVQHFCAIYIEIGEPFAACLMRPVLDTHERRALLETAVLAGSAEARSRLESDDAEAAATP